MKTAHDALFLILEGNVAFTKEKLDGCLQYLSQAGGGSFFGEVGVFTRSIARWVLKQVALAKWHVPQNQRSKNHRITNPTHGEYGKRPRSLFARR